MPTADALAKRIKTDIAKAIASRIFMERVHAVDGAMVQVGEDERTRWVRRAKGVSIQPGDEAVIIRDGRFELAIGASSATATPAHETHVGITRPDGEPFFLTTDNAGRLYGAGIPYSGYIRRCGAGNSVSAVYSTAGTRTIVTASAAVDIGVTYDVYFIGTMHSKSATTGGANYQLHASLTNAATATLTTINILAANGINIPATVTLLGQVTATTETMDVAFQHVWVDGIHNVLWGHFVCFFIPV